MIKAAQLAELFVQDVERKAEPRWLTLVGVCGSGKTMLARQVFDEAKKYNPGAASLWVGGTGVYTERMRRPQCVWLTATDFADRCRKDFGYPNYLSSDFLVAIDDVGAARDTTSFISEALYQLCNVRLGKWTLFTSNLGLPEIAGKIDERVASRLIRDGNQCHRLAAGDYAMRKKS